MIKSDIIKSFNEKEMRIYEFISKNAVKVPYMTIRELASSVSVSTTTVLNFVKKVGYENYSSFKYEYKLQEEKVIHKDAKYDFKEIIQCLDKFDSDTYKNRFKEAADIIDRSDKIIFIGIGNSGMVAQYGARLFSSIGRFSFVINDPYLRIEKLEDDCVMIVLSISGETPEIIREVEDSKKFGCNVIAITTTENSTLARISDVTIPYYIESIYDDEIDITTQIPAIAILENISRIISR